MVIALGGGLGAYYVVTQNGGSPPAGNANVWMDTNGGTCTRTGGEGVSYDGGGNAASCSSVAAACGVANTGGGTNDVVRVAAGSYGAQATSCKETSWVTYYLDPSATFTTAGPSTSGNFYMKFIGGTIQTPSVNGNYVWYEDNDHAGTNDWNGSTVGDNISFPGGVHDVTLIGPGNITMNGCDSHSTDFWYINGGSSGDTYNILIKGFDLHAYPVCNAGDHVELIRIQTFSSNYTVRNVTIEGNIFYDCECDTAYIFVTGNANLMYPHDLTIRNNFFGDEPWPRILQTNDPNVTTCDHYTIEYNSAMSGAVWTNFTNCTATNEIFRANVTCGTGFADCGTSLSKPDYHITSAATNAYGQGGSTCPPTDIDNEARPQGTCDAGADEIAGP